MYRLYVDEVGTDGLTHLDRDNHRYLSLTGVAIKVDHARDHLEPTLNRIKGAVFKHDPDAPMVFHRKEILGFKGPYEILRNEEIQRTFNTQIMETFDGTEYTVITALIDKLWMVKQGHWEQRHPYHYLLELLVEKYTQFLERKDDFGDIMPESRQDKDALLQGEYNRIRQVGTGFVRAERITGVIKSNSLKFRKKTENIAGLQLCDLLAHPSHIYTRSVMKHDVRLGPFSSQVTDILVRRKYDRSNAGKIIGYGVKHLP